MQHYDYTQVHEGRVCDLSAESHVDLLDSMQMHEGSVQDGRLPAAVHAERVDPAQVHKGRVSDLGAVDHVERLDPASVHKGRIRDSLTPTHVHSVQPCTRVSSNIDEIRVDDRFVPPHNSSDTLTARAAGEAAHHVLRLPLITDSASIHGKSMTASRNSLQILRRAFDSFMVKNPNKPLGRQGPQPPLLTKGK